MGVISGSHNWDARLAQINGKAPLMKFGILGTGMVGAVLANRLVELGHEVQIGTRDPAGEKAKDAKEQTKGAVAVVTQTEAATFGDIVINAIAGTAAVEVPKLLAKEIGSKIVLDVTNPLDFSQGMPPRLSVGANESLGAQIQAALPNAKVVKALNTVNMMVAANPAMLPGQHVVFIAGDDDAAKRTTANLLKEFGWSSECIIDIGGIENSRLVEALVPLWVAIAMQRGSFVQNWNLVFGEAPQS